MTIITSRRFAVVLATAIGLVLSSWCLGQNDKAEKAKPKALAPPPKITISKETTWAIEPRRDDGFIDYLEVLNRRYSKDVTVENNACVLLYQAMGPSPDGTRMSDRFFRRMGIERLPDEGQYFQSFRKWAASQDNAPPINQINDMEYRADERPWKAAEFPLVAAWLKENEIPLLLVVAATERPRYFSPLVNADANPDGGLIEVMLPGVQESRALARALAARAMWELAEGSQFDAWRDLMAMHRLGRLVGQGPTLIEFLTGVAIESMAFQGEFRFLAETKPTAKLMTLYRKQLDHLPARALIADKLDVGERICFLDCAHRVARNQMTLNEIFVGREDNPLIDKLSEGVIARMVDWDEVLKSGNQWFDRLAEISRMPDFLARTAAMTKLEEDVKKLSEQKRGPLALLDGKPTITQAMSDTLISLQLPSVTQVHGAEGRVIQRMRNLELAFAMAIWRSEHDSYPESLDILAPKYIAEVPKDHFNGQPLKYERTDAGYRFYSVGKNGKDDEGRSYDEGADDLVVRTAVAKDAK